MSDNVRVLGLKLNVYEVVHLVDSIDGIPQPAHPEQRGSTAYQEVDPNRSLLSGLGHLYDELVPINGDFYEGCEDNYEEILVTEEDLWLIKRRVKTGDMSMDGTVNIGVGLLKKTFALLRAFQFPDLGIPDSADPSLDRRFTRHDKRHLGDPDTWKLLDSETD